MNKIVKYFIFAAAMYATASLSEFPLASQNLPDGVYLEKDGIAYRKTAKLKPGTSDHYIIDLEAFVIGNVTIEDKSVPADIVLVLDVSGSMNEQMYSYTEEYIAQPRDSYSMYDIYYYHDGYNENYPLLYYKHSDDNYYEVKWGSYNSNRRTYYYLYYTVGNTNYYLSGTTVSTTRPTGTRDYDDTIWTGVLYTYTQTETPLGTKLDNLKDAVEYFIDEIQKNDLYEKDGVTRRKDKDGKETALGNQISIVKFAMNNYYNSSASYNSDNAPLTVGNHFTRDGYNYTEVLADFTPTASAADVQDLKDAVNSMEAAGATAADYGMNLARLLIEKNLGEDRAESNKTVVFFTDGSPTYGNQFSTTVATNTIANAKAMKTGDDKVTVFTIGVFSGLSTSEANNVNNYMNYVSSNYPDATSFTQPGSPVSTDPNKLVYYQNASNSDLSSIFKTVAQQSGGSGNTQVSEGSVVTVDVVTSSFELPANATDASVTVLVAPCIGEKTYTAEEVGETYAGKYLVFGEEKEATQYKLQSITPHLDKTTKKVSTEGFDFSDNYCAAYVQDGIMKGRGYKQIIRFEIQTSENAVGGPEVATNEKSSGIFVDGKQIVEFNRPTVPIPISIWIKKQGLLGEDSAVFTISYARFQHGVDPTTLDKDDWKNFTKVMITKDSPLDTDGYPIEKLVGLDPNYFYRIKEDKWAWSYSYQDGGIQYTLGDNHPNPFIFVNTPKDTPKEAEATVRNVFEENTSSSATPTE